MTTQTNIGHYANGVADTFPAPSGDTAPTVTVNGTPATISEWSADSVKLASAPASGALVVVSRASNNASASGVPPAYDAIDDMLRVKSVQSKFRDSFGGAVLDTDKWTSSVGAGGTMTVSAGSLLMGSGNTANSQSWAMTKAIFTVPFRVGFDLALSQRIANQSFYVEAVSVDPNTGEPDGKHSCGFLFDGTTATTAKYEVQNSGQPRLSASATFPTTAGGVSVFEIEPFADECWFHGGVLDSTAGRSNSYRRHQSIPDPNAVYKLRLRWLNGGTAPASSTTATLRYLAVQDYAELTAEITAGRGNSVAGQALAASIVNTPSVTISGTPAVVATPATPTTLSVNAAATTNATLVKNAAGVLYGLALSNSGAAACTVKLYNKATAPVPGTDIPVLSVVMPAESVQALNLGAVGLRFATGIGMAITLNATDADTTALGATPLVKANLTYI